LASSREQCKFYLNGEPCPYINCRNGFRDLHENNAITHLAEQKNLQEVKLLQRKQEEEAKLLQARKEDDSKALQAKQQPGTTTVSRIILNPWNRDDVRFKIIGRHAKEIPNKQASTPCTARSISIPGSNSWDTCPESYTCSNVNNPAAMKVNSTGLVAAQKSVSRAIKRGIPITFQRFAELPYELRELVWKMALAEDRYEVTLRWRFKFEFGHYTHNKLVSESTSPRFLHVSRDTRELALKHYEKTFGTDTYRPSVYFNYDKDRLFIRGRGWRDYPEVYTL
jgi:hypothetical protein